MNLIIGGVVAIVLGYIIAALTELATLGNVLMVVGVVVALIGLVMLLVNRSGSRRL